MKDINPAHYQGVMIKGVEIQPADIIEAYFKNDGLLSQAAKYMLRAGRKPDSSYLKDVGKAMWWCARAVLAAGGTIDLPPVDKKKVSINGVPVVALRRLSANTGPRQSKRRTKT